MKIIAKPLLAFVSNFVALLAAGYFVPGFLITQDIITLLWVTGALTLLNLIIRPIIKLLLTPIIVLTLGIASLAINAGMLYLLDYLSVNVTITGIQSLIYATLIVSLINITVDFAARSAYKE